MPRKKKDEETSVETTTEATDAPAADTTDENTNTAVAGGINVITPNEAESPGDDSAVTEEPSIFDSVIDTVTSAAETVVDTVSGGVTSVVEAVTGSSDTNLDKSRVQSKRAEKIGVVASDKMTKTVVVRVDRVVKHQVYRKYIKRKKKFMAHDETGAAIGDKVRIIETRPLSAHKRWRVVEIIQKAEK